MWSFFNERGIKIREQNFVEDVADGKFAEYYPSGKKQLQGNFVNRLKHGTWSYWDAKGKLIYQVEFQNGKQVKVNVKLAEDQGKPF